MVEQNVLLQIIQFVGLITPALAILIELLIRFHGGLNELQSNRQIPMEIQVLFLGFSGILLGGMGIGIQFMLTLDNQLTQIAVLLIFGGLPLLALSVLAMHVRISVISGTDTGIIEGFASSLNNAFSVSSPLLLTAIVYFGSITWFRDEINNTINWWIFNNELNTVLYLYIIGGLFLYKTMYSLWSHEKIPSDNIKDAIEGWFVVSFTLFVFWLVLSGPVFVLYYFILPLGIPFITPVSAISSIPYIWGGIVALAAIYNEVDPDSD